MKVVLAVVLVAVATSTPIDTRSSEPCEKHTYRYVATANNSIYGTSLKYSGLRLEMIVDVVFSDSLWEMKIRNPVAQPLPIRPKIASYPLFAELVTYPIWFKLEQGKVVEIYPDPKEREEIVNIKRSVISAFQVSVADKEGRRIETETDVLGKCTVNVIESVVDDETVVLKRKDTDTCQNRLRHTILTPTLEQEARFVFGYSSSVHRIDTASGRNLVKSADIEQVEVFSPLSKDAGQLGTNFLVSLVWNRTVPISECPVKPSEYSAQSIECSRLRSSKPEDFTCGSRPNELIEKLSSALPHDVPDLFLELIREMRRCNVDELKELNETFTQCKKIVAPSFDIVASDNAKRIMEKHTFFLDALAHVGTEPAVKLIVQLITEPSSMCLNRSRKVELALSLAAVPFHYINPGTLLDYTLDLARKNSTNMTVVLVLGSVVNSVLKYPEGTWQDKITQAVDFLIKLLNEALKELPTDYNLMEDFNKDENLRKTQYFERAIHAIKALGNAGVPRKTITVLVKAIDDKRLQIEGRVIAIKALEGMALRVPHKIRELTLPIFFDISQEIEIRIAAFEVYMATVRGDTTFPARFMDLIQKLNAEKNDYVRSFTCTYLIALDENEDPTIRRERLFAHYLLNSNGLILRCLATNRGYFSSKVTRGYVSLADFNLPRSLPRDVMGIGFSTGTVNTETSFIPRSASSRVYANMFGYDVELFEVGARGTGIDRLIQHLFGPTGYLRRGTRNIKPSGLKDDITLDLKEEDISASAFLKVLGSEVSWGYIEQPTIMRLLYNNDELNNLRKTITEATFSHFSFEAIQNIFYRTLDLVTTGKTRVYHDKFNFTKTVRFFDIKRTIPTILGLPLNITAVAAGHLQVDAEAAIDYCTKTPIVQMLFGVEPRDRIEAYGEIRPNISVVSEVQVVLDGYDLQPKLVLRANATSNFTQSARAVLHDNFTVNVQILEVPESSTMLLNASYIQYAEIDGETFVIGIDKRNNTELYEPISHSDLILLTNISYPNSTDVDQAPFFPLSGPANFTVVLNRTNMSELTGFNIMFWNETILSLDEGVFNLSVDAVGIGRKLAASAIWFTNEKLNEKVVNLNVVSLPVNGSAFFTGNTKKRVDIEGFVSVHTDVSDTTVYTRFNRTHFYGNASRIRHTEDKSTAIIVEPEIWLEVNSSLHNNTFGNISAELLVGDSKWPHWVRANLTTRGLMVDINAESNLFTKVSAGYILLHPLLSPICHAFDGHFITFDGLAFEQNLSPECEYILVRHRHQNDTFAVTMKDKDVTVYINGTRYTLKEDNTLLVDDVQVPLPYKVKHVIYVRKVLKNNRLYIHLSAWAGVDIFYLDGKVQLAVNGFYMNQTAGLCSDANYSVVDEMVMPLFTVAKNTKGFVKSWRRDICKRGNSTPTPVTITASEEECKNPSTVCCSKFKKLSEAEFFVQSRPFFHACLRDVKRGNTEESSIEAYILAASAKQIDVDLSE